MPKGDRSELPIDGLCRAQLRVAGTLYRTEQ
jgi:hypothetical protein